MNPWCLLIAMLFPENGPVRVRAIDQPPGIEVVTDLPADSLKRIAKGKVHSKTGRRWLTFALVGPKGKTGPAMFGRYQRRGNLLVFTPRIPPSPGRHYRATFRVSDNNSHSVDYRAPKRVPGKPAAVERVYPSASTLPANNLKFYIHFSKPMREGKAVFDSIQLVDERGRRVDDPWRRVEIWSRDYKRLTLFVHPGRIKTGLKLRKNLGPVLEPGRKYRLVITNEVRDVTGVRIAKPFTKSFQAVAVDAERPLPQQWKLTPPSAGTREPLKLEFGEPLDRLLLTRMLAVRDSNGRLVKGVIAIGKSERSWSFRPNHTWKPNNYRLDVDPQLEDLAGNTPVQLFDRDVKKPAGKRPRLSRTFRAAVAKPQAANPEP